VSETSTASLHRIRFPAESAEYREARDELLRAEIELRQQIEEVATFRRQLPPGGHVDRLRGEEPGKDRCLAKSQAPESRAPVPG
jgi:predicted dithiol-disulfide oxidoreductase (DUF899 family)